jgi:DNA helicase-2/ATP-dependent DNA helicase PcrA
MGNFHSVLPEFCSEASLLGYPSNFTIYDSQDSLRAISGIIKEMQIEMSTSQNKY